MRLHPARLSSESGPEIRSTLVQLAEAWLPAHMVASQLGDSITQWHAAHPEQAAPTAAPAADGGLPNRVRQEGSHHTHRLPSCLGHAVRNNFHFHIAETDPHRDGPPTDGPTVCIQTIHSLMNANVAAGVHQFTVACVRTGSGRCVGTLSVPRLEILHRLYVTSCPLALLAC